MSEEKLNSIYAGSPCNKEELIAYCKRKLGAPVLTIDIKPEQENDIINDTLQFFHEYCFGGMIKTFMTYKVTEEDIERFKSDSEINEGNAWREKNNYIEVPDHVTGINRIFGVNSSEIRGNLFGLEYRIFTSDLYHLGTIDLLNYYMVKSYLETINLVLNNGSHVLHRFHVNQGRLYLDTDILTIEPDSYLLIEGYRFVDPSETSKLYNDIFVKRYATALMKKQWGQNLIKYTNVTLPGGVTLNGKEIYLEGVRELEKIEHDVPLKYAEPPLDRIA